MKIMLVLMMILMLLPMATYAYCGNPSSSNGVVSLWKFDDDVLDSIGSNDGTRYNFTDGYVSGKYGNALNFNSTAGQFVDAGNNSSLNFGPGDFSIETWVKFNQTGLDHNIIGKIDFDILTGYLLYITGSGSPDFLIQKDENLADCVSITPINDNNWHHLVGTRTGDGCKLYVDGNLDTEASGIVGDINAIVNLTMGALNVSGSINYFNGTIDNTRIWNRVLTSDEILDLYENDNLGSCGVNYTELDINHTSYVRCLTNDTLHMSEWSAYGGVYYPHNKTEWCDNGCDNTTNTCNPTPANQNLILFAIIIFIVIAGWILMRWARR